MTNDDPKRLAQQRFDTAGSEPLDARHIVYTATDVQVVVDTLMDALRPVARPGSRIVELGFGHGDVLQEMRLMFPEVRLHGLDLAKRYAGLARERLGEAVEITVGDMERLPYSSASFDAVLTCWTLYFMRDLDAALQETRRIIRPGGIFVTATNARDHMREYTELAATAVRDALGRDISPDIDVRFDIDTGGDAVRRTFPNVELREWRGTLTVTTVGEVEALWSTYGDWSVTPEQTPSVLDALRSRTSAMLARDGASRSGGMVEHSSLLSSAVANVTASAHKAAAR